VPSIAKVAPEIWDPVHPTRAALINNISASVRGGKTSGADHVLPLCAPETLRTLDLDVESGSRPNVRTRPRGPHPPGQRGRETDR